MILVPRERLLLCDGRPVALTPKAFDLLVHFAGNPRRLLTKDELMSAVWPDVVVEESNLAHHVFAIRKALGEAADGEPVIETVPKQGYRFVAPVVVEDESAAVAVEAADMSDSSPDTPPIAASWDIRSWLLVASSFVAGALVMAGFDWLGTPPRHPAAPMRLQELAWNRLGLTANAGTWQAASPSTFLLSPDDEHLAATVPGDDGVIRVWVRAMDTLAPKRLPGTEMPFSAPLIWSPDSRTIAFDATGNGALRKASLAGGAPQIVCDLEATAVGGSWNRDGVILVGNAAGGIMRCPADGGVAVPVTRAEAGELHLLPSFLSDGRHFIYLRISRVRPEASGVYVTALDANPTSARRLFTSGFGATYVRALDGGPGFIVFGRDGALFAQRFDERRLEPAGDAVQLAASIGSFLDYAFFSASETTLVHREPEPPYQLTWFERDGVTTERVGTPEHLAGLALSPNDDRMLVVRHSPQSTADQDVWQYDIARRSYKRATLTPMLEFHPVWVSNDRFVHTPGGGNLGIYEQAIGGEPRLLFRTDGWDVATSSSGDGRLLLFTRLRDPDMRNDVWLRDGRAEAGDGVRLISGKFDQGQASLSPDQRLVAYVSNESGSNEVFAAELYVDPATGAHAIRNGIPVSQGGGFAPRWRGDGRELFYLKADGSVMAVDVSATKGLSLGSTERLFVVPGVIPEWGVTRNGRRFLFAVPTGPPAPYDVIRNWQSLLPK